MRGLQTDKAAQSAKAATNRGAKETTRGGGNCETQGAGSAEAAADCEAEGLGWGRRGWQETASDMANNDNGAARGDGGGKIFALCMIWGLRTKITPLDGKIFARCIP